MSAMRSASSMHEDARPRRGRARPRSSRSIRRPGVATDDLDACASRLRDLRVHRRAAVERGDAHADASCRAGASTSTTCLASSRVGHEHERRRVAGLGLADASASIGQAEGERLARAGLGLAAHVAAGEGVGDGGGLDGERLVDALRREGVDDLGPEAERLGMWSRCLLEPVRRVGGRSSASPERETGEGRPRAPEMVGTRNTRIAAQSTRLGTSGPGRTGAFG